MNRRRFIHQLGSAVAAFTILPSATTYARRWVRTENLFVPNPDYVNAMFRIDFPMSLDDYLWYANATHRLFGEFEPVIPDSVLRQKLHLPSST